MTIALERGEIFSRGARLAFYDAATETVFSAAPLAPPQRRAIEKALGLKPAFRLQPAKPRPRAAASASIPHFDSEPPRDPHLGDKTPAWAAWLQRRDPAAFATRYRLDSAFPRLSSKELLIQSTRS